MVFLLLLNHFVKVVFPVEHQTEGRLALQTLGEALFAEAELCASPLFYLWVWGSGDRSKHFVPKLGYPEVGVSAEKLSKLPLALVSVRL